MKTLLVGLLVGLAAGYALGYRDGFDGKDHIGTRVLNKFGTGQVRQNAEERERAIREAQGAPNPDTLKP